MKWMKGIVVAFVVLANAQVVFHNQNQQSNGIEIGKIELQLSESENNQLKQFQLEDNSANDKSKLFALHKHLVQIKSVTNDELMVALYLKQVLLEIGLHVHLQKVEEDRYNVFGFKGRMKVKKKVVLTSHIDTVPPYIPYSTNGTKIYGRGSCDAKASIASQIAAAVDLFEDLQDDDLCLLYVVGEEVNGIGMDKVSELGISFDVGIFGEPTELKLGKGHKGNYMFDLEVHGKASHSGYPELGISASEIMIPVLSDLLKLELPVSDILGPSTLNIGKFDGGVAANVIPADASASVFIRVAQDLDKIDEKVKKLVNGIDHLSFNLKQTVHPVYLDYHVPGFDSIVLAYATDIPHLSIPLKKRYLFGPGSIHVAHSDHEYVEVDDLKSAVKGYKKLVEYVLKNDV